MHKKGLTPLIKAKNEGLSFSTASKKRTPAAYGF